MATSTLDPIATSTTPSGGEDEAAAGGDDLESRSGIRKGSLHRLSHTTQSASDMSEPSSTPSYNGDLYVQAHGLGQ